MESLRHRLGVGTAHLKNEMQLHPHGVHLAESTTCLIARETTVHAPSLRQPPSHLVLGFVMALQVREMTPCTASIVRVLNMLRMMDHTLVILRQTLPISKLKTNCWQ